MSQRIALGLGLLGLALVLSSVADAGEDESGRVITGRVLDASGSPVRSARIEVQADRGARRWETIAESTSTAMGNFSVGGVPALPSVLWVRASSEGLATSRVRAFPGAVVTLRLGPAGVIEGRVLRDVGGEPVPGFRVEVEPGSGSLTEQAVTGPDGGFRFTGVPAGRCFLGSAAGEASQVTIEGVEVRPGKTTVRDIWLPAGTAVWGRVSGEDGKPLVGARVRCSFRETRTDSSGSYRLQGIPPHEGVQSYGPPEIEVEASGFHRFSQEVIFSPGIKDFRLDAVLVAGPSAPRLAMLRGKVIREGRPISGARVSLEPSGPFVRPASVLVATGDDGTFEFDDALSRGDGRVYACTGDGLVGVSSPATGAAAESAPLVIEMCSSAVIRGTVRDGSGKPVAGFRVGVRSAGEWMATKAARYITTAVSDDGGRYRLSVPPGRVVLEAGQGRAAVERVLEAVAPGALVEAIDFVTGDAGPGGSARLTGSCVDEDGRPIEGASVFAFGLMADTDPQGKFSLEGVGEETYCVNFTHPDFADMALFHVKTSRSPLRVMLQRGLQIRGRVLAEPGVAPARSFKVWMYCLREDIPWSECREQNDGEGRFVLRSLEPGVYSLRIQAEGRSSRLLEGIEVSPGKPAPEVTIPLRDGGRISGSVVDLEGGPCPYLEVWGSGPLDRDEANDYREWHPVATTDATGHFVWAGLVEGKHWVSLRAGEPPAEGTRSVEVTGGKGADKDFEGSMRTVQVLAGKEAEVRLTR